MGIFRKKYDLQQIAHELEKSLKTQRIKWFKACLEIIRKMDKETDEYQESELTGEVDLIIKSFQVVHVLAFISMQKYLPQKQVGDFTKKLCSTVFGTELEEAVQFINRYEKLKATNQGEKFNDQFHVFSEDVALSIVGSPKGMVFSAGLDLIVFDFYFRNLKLAALVFGDIDTAEKIWQPKK